MSSLSVLNKCYFFKYLLSDNIEETYLIYNLAVNKCMFQVVLIDGNWSAISCQSDIVSWFSRWRDGQAPLHLPHDLSRTVLYMLKQNIILSFFIQ